MKESIRRIDPGVSIARARIEEGVVTRWHGLAGPAHHQEKS